MDAKTKQLAEQYACHTETMTGIETEYTFDAEDLAEFAELIRADEREACAKLLDTLSENQTNQSLLEVSDCAEAIRARK